MAANRPGALQVYDPVLTGLARRFRPRGWIATRLTANQPSKTLTGQYPVFDKEYWFRVIADNEISDDRAPVNEIDYKFDLESYATKSYGLKISITDLERAQALSQLRLEKGKNEFLSNQMDMLHEIRVAAKLRKTGANGGDLTSGVAPSTNWDQDTAVIEADIKTGVIAVYDLTGLKPNTIVIPWKVAYAMALQEDIRAILRQDTTGNGVAYLQLGDRILPAVIHGMNVVIPESAQTASGNEGASVTLTEVWADHVRLLYIDQGAEWGIPSVLYMFDYTKRRVTRWSETDPDLDYIRQMERYSLKTVAPDLGYEIASVLS